MEVWSEIGTPVTTLNLFEETFLKNKEDQWHKPKPNVQHISQLTNCGLKTAFSIVNPIPKSIRTLGTFQVGNMHHEFIQDRYILRYPASVKEFPVFVLVFREINGKKIKIKVTGKIDLLDIGNSRIIDLKSQNHNGLRYIKSGSQNAPPGAKKSHIIQVIVYWYIWNYIIIRDPKSPYWIKECGVDYIDKDNSMDIYCPIPLDKYNAEIIFNQLIQEAIGVHQAVNLNDWHYLKNKWKYDPNWWLCKGYCEYSEDCKYSSHS